MKLYMGMMRIHSQIFFTKDQPDMWSRDIHVSWVFLSIPLDLTRPRVAHLLLGSSLGLTSPKWMNYCNSIDLGKPFTHFWKRVFFQQQKKKFTKLVCPKILDLIAEWCITHKIHVWYVCLQMVCFEDTCDVGEYLVHGSYSVFHCEHPFLVTVCFKWFVPDRLIPTKRKLVQWNYFICRQHVRRFWESLQD